MPKSELHKRKFKQNMAVLGLILGFFALVWAITMIRIGNNKVDSQVQETAIPAAAPAVE